VKRRLLCKRTSALNGLRCDKCVRSRRKCTLIPAREPKYKGKGKSKAAPSPSTPSPSRPSTRQSKKRKHDDNSPKALEVGSTTRSRRQPSPDPLPTLPSVASTSNVIAPPSRPASPPPHSATSSLTPSLDLSFQAVNADVLRIRLRHAHNDIANLRAQNLHQERMLSDRADAEGLVFMERFAAQGRLVEVQADRIARLEDRIAWLEGELQREREGDSEGSE
jgi:hypothetical protein